MDQFDAMSGRETRNSDDDGEEEENEGGGEEEIQRSAFNILVCEHNIRNAQATVKILIQI